MSTRSDPAVEFMARLDDSAARMEALLRARPPEGALTDPDQPSGEQWEWGQVWAHIAEFPGYWIEEIRKVLELPPDEEPEFGRVKTDPARVAAIEADRTTPVADLWERTEQNLLDLATLIADLLPPDWDRTVRHPTMGSMDLRKVVDEFLVAHYEEHIAQLEALVRG